MKRALAENSLSLFFFSLFTATIVAQSFAGQRAHNAEQTEHGAAPLSWWGYVTSPDFAGAVTENWQSEFLQFALFIFATVWLVQRGSNESKAPGEMGRGSPRKARVGGYAPEAGPSAAKTNGLRTRLYENSLLLVMSAIFVAAWVGQSVNNWRLHNEEQVQHDAPTVGWGGYLLQADFWERTLQNWQSEFLAVGTMAVFTIFLRQRGSPESKPVGAPHEETGSSG
ncbi:MAG: DUF6766 family protein [Gaiella sp.]